MPINVTGSFGSSVCPPGCRGVLILHLPGSHTDNNAND